MNIEHLIEKHLFGNKPDKWDDEFDRIQDLSVNDVRALLEEHAQYVLSPLIEEFNKEMRSAEERAGRVEVSHQRRFYQGEARAWKYAAKKLQRFLSKSL